MGKDYSNTDNGNDHGDSGNTLASCSSASATIDGSVDEPPIQEASSSQQLTEKSGGETCCIEKVDLIEDQCDIHNIAACAHTVDCSRVAHILQTDIE